MKKLFLSLLVGLLAMTLLPGCLVLNFEGSKKSATSNTTTNSDQHPVVDQATTAPTLGQQLVDLQKAKDSGVITDAEYQAQKAKLLENK
jgi:hypothetical protein